MPQINNQPVARAAGFAARVASVGRAYMNTNVCATLRIPLPT
jgi:hypothetical protein